MDLCHYVYSFPCLIVIAEFLMQTPSHTLLGIQHDNKNSDRISLSAIGKAFARADLNEVHEILLHDGYDEDDTANAEVKELFAIKPYS